MIDDWFPLRDDKNVNMVTASKLQFQYISLVIFFGKLLDFVDCCVFNFNSNNQREGWGLYIVLRFKSIGKPLD